MSRHGSFADQVNVRSRGLKEPEIPKVDELFNVHVTLVCSPGNFIVQPYDYKTKLEVIVLFTKIYFYLCFIILISVHQTLKILDSP